MIKIILWILGLGIAFIIVLFVIVIIQTKYEHKDYERVLKKYNKDVEIALQSIPYEKRRCDNRCKYQKGIMAFEDEGIKHFATCYHDDMDDQVCVEKQIGCKYYTPSWVLSESYNFHIVD